MKVTRIKWSRKGLRAVHGQHGVGVMLKDLAQDICDDAAASVGTVTGGGKALRSVTGEYADSFRAVLIYRPKTYYVAWAANTSDHARFIEFGTYRTDSTGTRVPAIPAYYPLTKAAKKWRGAR